MHSSPATATCCCGWRKYLRRSSMSCVKSAWVCMGAFCCAVHVWGSSAMICTSSGTTCWTCCRAQETPHHEHTSVIAHCQLIKLRRRKMMHGVRHRVSISESGAALLGPWMHVFARSPCAVTTTHCSGSLLAYTIVAKGGGKSRIDLLYFIIINSLLCTDDTITNTGKRTALLAYLAI